MNTYTCMECGEDFPEDDVEFDEQENCLCLDCRELYYTCEDCGCFVHQDEAHYNNYDEVYCESCIDYHRDDEDDEESELSYSNPIFKFNKTYKDIMPRKFFGIELEIDEGYPAYECANCLTGAYPDIWCKSDGSLSSHGIEIVSHPSTLSYHVDALPWRNIIKTCKQYGYEPASRCGLHIHVSRSAFGKTIDTQDKNIGKLVYMVDNMWDEIVKFSRRRQSAIDSWASKLYIGNTPKEDLQTETLMSKYKMSGGMGRYRCVNITPSKTIEFRIFASTLNPMKLYASLEFTHIITELSKELTIKDTLDADWSTIYEYATRNHNENFIRFCESYGGILCPV